MFAGTGWTVRQGSPDQIQRTHLNLQGRDLAMVFLFPVRILSLCLIVSVIVNMGGLSRELPRDFREMTRLLLGVGNVPGLSVVISPNFFW